MQGRTTEAYAKSNSYAQQSLSQIRTVVAYGGEERALQVYDQSLEVPTRSGEEWHLFSGVFSLPCFVMILLANKDQRFSWVMLSSQQRDIC
jgi:hypothetical protein